MEEGRFWQILDRHNPYSPLQTDDAKIVSEGRTTGHVAAEVLRCAGEMRNEATREARRQLLERALESPSHVVRDGAVVGLSRLADPLAIPALAKARAALPEETEDAARFLLQLMKRLDMCFPLDEEQAGKPPGRWLVPGAPDPESRVMTQHSTPCPPPIMSTRCPPSRPTGRAFKRGAVASPTPLFRQGGAGRAGPDRT